MFIVFFRPSCPWCQEALATLDRAGLLHLTTLLNVDTDVYHSSTTSSSSVGGRRLANRRRLQRRLAAERLRLPAERDRGEGHPPPFDDCVPQIWRTDGFYIGGCTDLQRWLLENNTLPASLQWP